MSEHDLLGYLLGLLEAEEHRRVEELVQSDETIRVQVEVLRQCLEPLACDAEHPEPPEGLAVRVCQTLRQVHIELRRRGSDGP